MPRRNKGKNTNNRWAQRRKLRRKKRKRQRKHKKIRNASCPSTITTRNSITPKQQLFQQIYQSAQIEETKMLINAAESKEQQLNQQMTVDGFIREFSPQITQIIPTPINQLCFLHYYDLFSDIIIENVTDDDQIKNCDEECVIKNEFDFIKWQTDLTSKMRCILVDWMISVHRKFQLSQSSLFLAINLLDRYLAKQQVHRTKFQLAGIHLLHKNIAINIYFIILIVVFRLYLFMDCKQSL